MRFWVTSNKERGAGKSELDRRRWKECKMSKVKKARKGWLASTRFSKWYSKH